MANKTISVPDDVLPIIDSLGMPFSRWVAEQLRRHAAATAPTFAEQLVRDAELAHEPRPDRASVGERMGRTAPW